MEPRDLKRAKPGACLEEIVLETIRAGYRSRDAAKVLSVYAENVECTIVNRNNPPSRPLVLRGREAFRRVIDDICTREMTHAIVEAVTGNGSLAYRVECRYPDGCNVVGHYIAKIEDGRIVSETSVDCWDE